MSLAITKNEIVSSSELVKNFSKLRNKVKENSKATVEPIIKLNKQVCSFTLNNYQRNIENLKRNRKTYSKY